MRVLSFGAGVNTFALLAMAKKGELNVDYVVFADTGGEYPETYHLIEEVAKPATEAIGIPFIHLHPAVEGSPNLYDYCLQTRMIPVRIERWCTDKFKVRPIKEWIASQGLHGCDVLIGFDAGEKHRAENAKKIRLYHKVFPLIEQGIDRRGCKKIIESVGWPPILKSGCYFCSFSSLRQHRWLHDTHPDLYAKAEVLEKNGGKYPGATIYEGRTLEEIRLRRNDGTLQESLGGFDDECGEGVCFR